MFAQIRYTKAFECVVGPDCPILYRKFYIKRNCVKKGDTLRTLLLQLRKPYRAAQVIAMGYRQHRPHDGPPAFVIVHISYYDDSRGCAPDIVYYVARMDERIG